MAEQLKVTAAEFLALPETTAPTELIRGDIIVSPAPNLIHQNIVVRLTVYLTHLTHNGQLLIAPTDVYLDDANVVQPDVMWLAPNSQCQAVEDKNLKGAPELVVEVLSPATGLRDRREKYNLYETFGVQEYWIVDPAGDFVEVYQRDDDHFQKAGIFGIDDSFISKVLGEQMVEVKQIFDG